MSVLPVEDVMDTSNEKKPEELKKPAKSLAGKKRKRTEIEAEEEAPAVNVDGEAPVPDDETPLSHKQQRKVKKLRVKAVDSDPSAITKSTPAESAQTSPEKPARQNSIWVGNLAFKTMESDIKLFFEKCGEVTRIHMPRKMGGGPEGGMRGQNMGFAYVDFATPEVRDAAVKLSESPLHGRKLLIKDGKDYRGRPTATEKAAQAVADDTTGSPSIGPKTALSKTAQRILKSQKHPPGPTLFMGNLGFETTDATIREMLEGHWRSSLKVKSGKEGVDDDEDDEKIVENEKDGKEREEADVKQMGLRKVRLGTFEDSGVCKGWAFLDFHTSAQAQAVLTNQRNHLLNGRKLVLEFGSADAVRRGGGRPAGAHSAPEKGEAGERRGGMKREKKIGGGKSAGYDKKNRGRLSRLESQGESGAAKHGDDEEVPLAFPSAPARDVDERPAKRQKPMPGRERPTSAPEFARKSGRDKPARRLKPGAALALAVQSTAKTGVIVASQGKKITFS